MGTLQLSCLLSETFDDDGHEAVAMQTLRELAHIHVYVDHLLVLPAGRTGHEKLKRGIVLGDIHKVAQLRSDQRLFGFDDKTIVLRNVVGIGQAVEGLPHQT